MASQSTELDLTQLPPNNAATGELLSTQLVGREDRGGIIRVEVGDNWTVLPTVELPSSVRAIALILEIPAIAADIQPVLTAVQRWLLEERKIYVLLRARATHLGEHGSPCIDLASLATLTGCLREVNATIAWLMPVEAKTVFALERFFHVASQHGVFPILEPATARVGTQDEVLNNEEILFLRDFLRYRILEEDRSKLTAAQFKFYEAWCQALERGENYEPEVCVNRTHFEIGAEAGKWQTVQETRSPLTTLMTPCEDEAPTNRRGRHEKLGEIASVLVEGLATMGSWLASLPRKPAKLASLPRVMLIGAYGGEHIGDAAILGGVLFRIHQEWGTTSGILMSQRADHTKHLTPMLDTPVSLRVEPYERERIRHCLREVDGIVYAGGPMMDLPKQLVKHFYTVSLARKMGKPFVVEGVGAGPFVRRASAWVARRLLSTAQQITLRTSADAKAPVLRGLDYSVGRDPAFDYLATRASDLNRIPEVDRNWISSLLLKTEGRQLVGLNIRPIRHEYTVGVAEKDKLEYTRQVETRFIAELSSGLVRFADASERPVSFIFFPMNAIQFGHSDLRSAFRIQDRLPDSVDFRIWEGDASLDGVLQILRQLDVVVAMRFHAAIFALSQELPVIGIDYCIGKRDKVAAVLADSGVEENCARIDLLRADWLCTKLLELT